jgi:hypothetical protein
MSDPPSRILRRGRHRRVRAGLAFSDEGRSERVRAANEFQIVEDLQAALAQFAEWSEWDERHRRCDEGRSERARAANKFQIAADLKR